MRILTESLLFGEKGRSLGTEDQQKTSTVYTVYEWFSAVFGSRKIPKISELRNTYGQSLLILASWCACSGASAQLLVTIPGCGQQLSTRFAFFWGGKVSKNLRLVMDFLCSLHKNLKHLWKAWCREESQVSPGPMADAFVTLWQANNYFTSCDPHHDIYTFCYWQIFWHSI